MKRLIAFLLVAAMVFPAVAFAGGNSSGYFKNMGQDYWRGLKNVITGPLEIPITVQDYHEQAGAPVIRHLAGFVDGTFRALTRMGSGLFDFMAGVLPGYQEGFPVKPETLF